jgi:peptidoglycan hydrolase-like protein with peptidoglycan-binding domain
MKRVIGRILAGATLCVLLSVVTSVQAAPGDNPAIAIPPPSPEAPPASTASDPYVIHSAPTPFSNSPGYSSSNKDQSYKQAAKKPAKKKKTTRKRSRRTASHHTSGRSHVRTAQIYLDQLGYNPGEADGIMGARTKAAIKAFQRDHHLRATGALTDATFRALSKEAGSRNPTRSSRAPQADFLASHPDFYGYYGKEGVNPTELGSPQTIPTRFGNVEISQQQNGSSSNYVVTINGQMVMHAENQPSYVNVSRTFNLDDADAILVTSYTGANATCPYRHQLLIVRTSGSGARNIAECSRDYEAYSENGMLLISFPGNHVDGISTGASWRYDHGTLEKL